MSDRDKIVINELENHFTGGIVKVSSIESYIDTTYRVKKPVEKGFFPFFKKSYEEHEKTIHFEESATIEVSSEFFAVNYKIKISMAFDDNNNIVYWKYKI